MNRKLRVRIVEDDRDFAESLAVHLGMEGHEVTRAAGGEAGLARMTARAHGLSACLFEPFDPAEPIAAVDGAPGDAR